MLPEHAHLSPVLAGLPELSGRHPLPGAGGLAAQGRRAGRPGCLHVPHLRQHAGGLQAPSEPGESGLVWLSGATVQMGSGGGTIRGAVPGVVPRCIVSLLLI